MNFLSEKKLFCWQIKSYFTIPLFIQCILYKIIPSNFPFPWAFSYFLSYICAWWVLKQIKRTGLCFFSGCGFHLWCSWIIKLSFELNLKNNKTVIGQWSLKSCESGLMVMYHCCMAVGWSTFRLNPSMRLWQCKNSCMSWMWINCSHV